MSASIEWLRDYVDIAGDGEQLAEELTMAGIAIEGVETIENDRLLNLDLTPNRGDCLGMINLAREIAAIRNLSLRIPELELIENSEDVNDYVRITIEDPDLCLRYCARVIKNVQAIASPEWLQQRLISAGVRPVNVPVDITNYVMLECNQPLHAFDYDLLQAEPHIIVRRAHAEETIITLDDVERHLDEDILLITDQNRPVAIAGIMGGQNTMIQEQTHNILLESACFYNISTRRSSKRLGLRSDSSIRFEKGVDPNGCTYAVDRAAMLMQQLGGGEIVGGIADCYPVPIKEQVIQLRYAKAERVLGVKIEPELIQEYMRRLRFAYTEDETGITVTVPTYRPDITGEEDLIEELTRLYGYDRIPASMPLSAGQGGLDAWQVFREELRLALSHFLREAITYSFISPRHFDLLGLLADDPWRHTIAVANPLSEEQSVMRSSLLPGLLEAVNRNLARQNENPALFELGAIYQPPPVDLDMPVEKLKLAIIAVGETTAGWNNQAQAMDYYYLKGILERLGEELHIGALHFERLQHPMWHPGRSAQVKAGDLVVGIMGEIHPLVQEAYAIKHRIAALELDVEALFQAVQPRLMQGLITRYPAVERDIALIVDRNLSAETLVTVIHDQGGNLLQKVRIFDIYTGAPIATDRKSMALRLEFRSAERTLTEEEITPILSAILLAVQEKCGASLR